MKDAEAALKRAVIWIDILIGVAEVEPDETNAKFSVGDETLALCNLGDDLKAFEALGAAGWPEARDGF